MMVEISLSRKMPLLIFTSARFGRVWFYGISTIVGYLMPNLAFTYILNIYDLYTRFFDAFLNKPDLLLSFTIK